MYIRVCKEFVNKEMLYKRLLKNRNSLNLSENIIILKKKFKIENKNKFIWSIKMKIT